jgi:hypothetical protein
MLHPFFNDIRRQSKKRPTVSRHFRATFLYAIRWQSQNKRTVSRHFLHSFVYHLRRQNKNKRSVSRHFLWAFISCIPSCTTSVGRAKRDRPHRDTYGTLCSTKSESKAKSRGSYQDMMYPCVYDVRRQSKKRDRPYRDTFEAPFSTPSGGRDKTREPYRDMYHIHGQSKN